MQFKNYARKTVSYEKQMQIAENTPRWIIGSGRYIRPLTAVRYRSKRNCRLTVFVRSQCRDITRGWHLRRPRQKLQKQPERKEHEWEGQ